MTAGGSLHEPNPHRERAFLILTPVLDDWASLSMLLDQLDREFSNASLRVDVLAVDDGSTQSAARALQLRPYENIGRVATLILRRNVGHQRALAIGLAYVEANLRYDAVVLMDADGEDVPSDAVRLINEHIKCDPASIVFALRKRRSEGFVFRCFYALYRMTFRMLIGHHIRFGNFSLIPADLLHRLVGVSELWNNYPAAVLRSRIPWRAVPCDRGSRFAGNSRMNFTGLISHGLGAISVFGEVVGTRALLATMVLCAASMALGGVAVGVRVFTDLAIPGWATAAVGMSVLLMLQSMTLSMFFVFIILSSRNQRSFMPMSDYVPFVLEYRVIANNASSEDVGSVVNA